MMLIEHHTKYKEIHGYDESVWMDKGEHRKLHNRLRREGKCNISPEKLDIISRVSYQRSDKVRERKQENSLWRRGEIYDWREL